MTDIEAVKARLREDAKYNEQVYENDDVTALLDAHDAAAARIAKLEEALKPLLHQRALRDVTEYVEALEEMGHGHDVSLRNGMRLLLDNHKKRAALLRL